MFNNLGEFPSISWLRMKKVSLEYNLKLRKNENTKHGKKIAVSYLKISCNCVDLTLG